MAGHEPPSNQQATNFGLASTVAGPMGAPQKEAHMKDAFKQMEQHL